MYLSVFIEKLISNGLEIATGSNMKPHLTSRPPVHMGSEKRQTNKDLSLKRTARKAMFSGHGKVRKR